MSEYSLKPGTFALKDWVDLRDQYYEPTLSTLRATLQLEKGLLKKVGEEAENQNTFSHYQPVFGVRDQTKTRDGRCAGYALAALIDLQTRLQNPAKIEDSSIVSADMLYWMGAYHERSISPEDPSSSSHPPSDDELAAEPRIEQQDGLRSLRSVIKGFYHHGVCPDSPDLECAVPSENWQSLCYKVGNADQLRGAEEQFPSVAQSRKAREASLGAYFRLRPVLNHFHAALNEVGAILVSAQIHEGWYAPSLPEANGVIDADSGAILGLHALVIVGYNELGFLVLNSWGPEWGGYRSDINDSASRIAGVALWSYQDWSRNIVDAWVLRLGVSAPSAFSSSIGEQGWKKLLNEPIRSVPCHELLGHYMHLDDGFHVKRGPYPSLPENWTKTRNYLDEVLGNKYRGVLIWIPGSLEDIEDAFESATRIKDMAKSRKLYPYVVFWCSTFVEKSMALISTLFDSCTDQAAEGSAELNALIEDQLQGVGRAIWRDIEHSATRAVCGFRSHPYHDSRINVPEGSVTCLVDDMLALKRTKGTELHLVAEGAGALIVQELLRNPGSRAPLHSQLDTLSLSIPAIGLPRANKHLVPLVKAMNARQADSCACDVPGYSSRERKQSLDTCQAQRKPAPARIYVPSADLESRLYFGSYSGSLLQLVSRAFEDRWLEETPPSGQPVVSEAPGNPPRTFLGMAKALDTISEGQDHGSFKHLKQSWSEIQSLSEPSLSKGPVPQVALFRDPSIIAEIFRSIDAHGTPDLEPVEVKHDSPKKKSSSSTAMT